MSQPSIDYYNEALDALHAGKPPEALAAIVNSLTEDPKDTQTWQLYIVILNALGRTDDARRATEKLKEMGLSEVEELVLKAVECTSAGDLAAAIPHYQAAIALDPRRADLNASLAIALLQSGDPEAALATAKKAVAIDSGDAHAQYALGHILRLGGNEAAALVALSQAVALDPEFMLALYEEGMLLALNGEFQAALANFEKFLSVHPDDPGATEAVTNLRKSSGRRPR
jgi:tetratricopeptide (TPR) repeat protein